MVRKKPTGKLNHNTYTENLFQSAVQISEFHIQTSNVCIYYDVMLEAKNKRKLKGKSIEGHRGFIFFGYGIS